MLLNTKISVGCTVLSGYLTPLLITDILLMTLFGISNIVIGVQESQLYICSTLQIYNGYLKLSVLIIEIHNQ